MLAELFQERRVLLEAGVEIEGQVLLARSKPYEKPVAGSSAGVAVGVAAEADDIIAPDSGLGPGGLAHKLHDSETIPALLLVWDTVQEFKNILIVWFGLQLRHRLLPSRLITQSSLPLYG